jgi:MYXO-CTERM domain-containing protein
MRNWGTGAIGALCVLLCGANASAADWWVDAAAAASGDGSEANPFRTINEAKSVLETGDTIWVLDGVYEETVDFWHVPDGTGGRTTLRAAPGAHPVVDGGGTDGFVLQAGETPDMTFQGLTVRNGDVGIEFYQADGGQVIECTTEATGGSVAFYYASQGLVSGSKLEGSVSGKGSDGTVIEDNEIFGSGAEGITLHADSKNCRYSRNVVHDNTSVNIYLDSISNTIVDANLVYMTLPTSATTIGIMLADESYSNVTAPVLENITITNNVIIDNESGIRFWDGHFPGQSALRNVTIANNTVINSETSAIKWDAGPHQGTVVQNNIFAGESGKQQLLLQANSVDGISLDHNLWYLPNVSNPFLWDTTTYDHAGWSAATGHGSGDVVENPELVGPWTRPVANLEPSDGAPTIDTGASLSVDHDHYGRPRPAGGGYDIGAFEYGAPGGGGGSAGSSGSGGSGGASGSGGAGGTSGAGAAAGTAGSAGTGGAAASGGGSGSSGAATGGTGTTPSTGSSDDDSGCGCRIGSRDSSPSPWLVGLLLLLIRRRRDARPSATR